MVLRKSTGPVGGRKGAGGINHREEACVRPATASTRTHSLVDFARSGMAMLEDGDPALYDLLAREYQRQSDVLTMVAASSIAHPSVLACEGTPVTNVTTEGYPGARFHAGCEVKGKTRLSPRDPDICLTGTR